MNLPTAKSSGLLAAGTNVVKAGRTYVKSVSLTGDGVNAATLVVYDSSAAASGTVIAKLFAGISGVTNEMTYTYPVRAENGIVAVVSGTGAEAIVTFDA